MMQHFVTAIVSATLLTACSPPVQSGSGGNAITTVEPAPTASPPDYTGRWTGVEGMFLDVRPGTSPGRYRLEMQYDLDHRRTADATLDGEALAFTRDGRRLTLRPTDGAATGLKYLADKKHCLTVAEGEGYCRD